MRESTIPLGLVKMICSRRRRAEEATEKRYQERMRFYQELRDPNSYINLLLDLREFTEQFNARKPTKRYEFSLV